MSNKIFVRRPQLGDYVCKRVSDRKVFYLDWQSADCPEGNMFEVDGETYEKIGSAVPYEGDKVLCLWREMAAKPFCERYMFRLTGYVLDGAEHTSTLSIREASNGWGTAVDYDITYAATTMADFVAQLNAYFAATEVFSAAVQDWWAEAADEGVVVGCAFIKSQQSSNTAKNGFELTVDLLPELTLTAGGYRARHGAVIERAVCIFDTAINEFRKDKNDTRYNPSKDVTSVQTYYPICLPAYLGTSAYQSDHCALLRSVYGEGEQGWLRYMESQMVLADTDYGKMGISGTDKVTASLAARRYSTSTKTNVPMCPAAFFAHDIETATVGKGEFYLPSAKEMTRIVETMKNDNRENPNADALSASRYKQGWPRITRFTYTWICSRRDAVSAWHIATDYGYFAEASFANTTIYATPVTQYQL